MALDCLLVHVPKLLEHHPLFGWSRRISFLSMGILSIAEELGNQSLRTRIVHLGVEKELDPDYKLADRVRAENVPVVAFALHWHPQTYDTIEAARQLKAAVPETRIIVGGLTAGFFARAILERYPFIDAVIRGEAERPLAQYVRAVIDDTDLAAVENLSWRHRGMIREQPTSFVTTPEDLNGWRFDAFDRLDHADAYFRQNWTNSWEPELKDRSRLRAPTLFGAALGRGCMGTCTWCAGSFGTTKAATGRKRTAWRTAERVAAMITRARTFGVERIYTCFDPLPNRMQEVMEVFEALGELSPKVPVDFETFGLPSEAMVDAFATHLDPSSRLIISPETANEALRDRHRAFPFSNAELEDRLAYMERANVESELYFIVGLPGDTAATIEATADWEIDLRARFPGVKSTFTAPLEMEPNSPWYLHPDRYNITLRRGGIETFHAAHGAPEMTLGYDLEHLREVDILALHQKHFLPLAPKHLENMRAYWLANARDYSALRVHA